jgi:hypothetical protein
LSVCSLARYKIACELIKFSTGNLPSSAFTPIFKWLHNNFLIKYVGFFYVSQYFWQMTMCNFISRILIDRLVLINLICLVRPILTNNSEISTKTFGIIYILFVYLLIMFIWAVFICT